MSIFSKTITTTAGSHVQTGSIITINTTGTTSAATPLGSYIGTALPSMTITSTGTIGIWGKPLNYFYKATEPVIGEIWYSYDGHLRLCRKSVNLENSDGFLSNFSNYLFARFQRSSLSTSSNADSIILHNMYYVPHLRTALQQSLVTVYQYADNIRLHLWLKHFHNSEFEPLIKELLEDLDLDWEI